MPDREPPRSSVPESRNVPKKRTRLSLVWFIPILAAIVGAWVAVTRVMSEGPKITIVMSSAEGLEAGKTKIHYNGVDIGTVKTIELSEDHQHAILTAQMAPKTEAFLVTDTKFWVVRPRISGANITGLGTLISGAYIGVEIGSSKEDRRDFVALETPPVITGETPGRFFVLKTSDLGSLDTGTPIYFRRLQVGQVASYALDPDGKNLTVKVFVQTPYDQYVNPNTRFWHASGIDVSLSASGLTVQTQSVLSILIGGIAFETAATALVLPPSDENAVFTLYSNRTEAFNPPPQHPQTYQLIFKDSVRGLSPGAPVEFRGINIGEVSDISAQIDLKTFEFSAPVTISLDPRRLGVKILDLGPGVNLETHASKINRRFGGAWSSRTAEDGEPPDGIRICGARLLPRRAACNGGLVANSSATADHVGPARSDRGDSGEHHQETRQGAIPGNWRRPAKGDRAAEYNPGVRTRHAGERTRHARQYQRAHRSRILRSSSKLAALCRK